MELSRLDRVILANQYTILQAIDSENAEHYEQALQVLKGGYELEYEAYIACIVYPDTMPYDECVLVIDVMDMYMAMQRSYDKLEDKSEIKEGKLDFPGFDGNHETRYMSYAEFVVEKQGKFTPLRFDKDRCNDTPPHILDRFNSHSPTLDLYRRRIEVWKSLSDKYNLSKDDISSILAVRAR